MPAPLKTLAVLAVLVLAVTAVKRDEPTSGPVPPSPGSGTLLQTAGGGDGDSWSDTAGTEYRLGLVNTPETGECYGSTATAQRESLTARGFYAQVYAHDTYGRHVAVVTTADGINVNVHLVRQGLADDRYLQQFRSENPGLASSLDEAFAAAKAERAGLWGACSTSGAAPAAPPAAQPVSTGPPLSSGSSCHPDYLTCIPVRGDGTGRGAANDLDCGSIGQPVELASAGADPYRLDADGDGYGCE
jgi:endonuclease YncB( thermonuclease family)